MSSHFSATRLKRDRASQGYHILALLLFSPALIAEPQLLAISLAIACALLIIVEAVRVSRVPYLGPCIHSFMTSFIDERDSGLLLVSHLHSDSTIGISTPYILRLSVHQISIALEFTNQGFSLAKIIVSFIAMTSMH